MSLAHHPLIVRVIGAGRAFRAAEISVEELQSSVSAAMSGLEGDVPPSVRDAMFQLEAEIDSARFTVGDAERPTVVRRSLEAFERCVSEAAEATPSDP